MRLTVPSMTAPTSRSARTPPFLSGAPGIAQCPIGPFGSSIRGRYAAPMDTEKRAELIERYRAGIGEVEAALEGANEADLDAVPADGEWSARMVVHHLADSEANSYVRVRTLLAEDEAYLQGY